MRRKKFPAYGITVYTLLFLGTAVMIYPFLWMILSAFKTTGEIQSIPPTFLPAEPTLKNFTNMWAKFNFAVFFRNSVFLSVTKTAIILYTSAISGYVLCKIDFKGRNAVFIALLATMMIPWPVLIIPQYQEMVWFKWLGKYSSIIVPAMFNSFGVFMMKQFIESIPTDLIEAARVDGSTEFGIFHKIVLPNTTAALSALGIFTFIWNWDDFLWPYLMINTENLYTLPIGLAQFNGQYYTDYGGTLAGATIAMLPVLIVFLLFQRRFIEGIALTGLKG